MITESIIVMKQLQTDQRVNFFIRTMQRDKFENILQESEYYQAYQQSKKSEQTLTEVLDTLENYNVMQDFYNKRELGIMIRIKEAFDVKSHNVEDKDFINNIFNKVYVDTLIHDYIFNNNPLVELKNANTGISELEWQEKIQAKEERLNQLQQKRIELLESVLDKQLTSTEFKDVAEQLNFRNPKDNRVRKTVKTLKPHLQELGFDIQEPKSKGITYKRIIKK